MTSPTVTTPGTRAAVYARISQDRTGAGLGVDRQEKDCRELADRLGWTVTEVFVDNDVSAYTGKRRPGYEELLNAIRAGRIDAVLTLHNDRLIKAPRELEDYIDLCSPRGIPTHTVWAGEFDLSTPTGRAVARTIGAWARFEGEHKSERTKRAQAQAAAAGKWLGGTKPFGWTIHGNKPSIHPRQAAEIIDATERILAGATLGSIVRDLNDRGIKTARGGRWDTTSLRAMLKRPRNAGIVTLNGEEIVAAEWPAILPEDTWRAMVAILDDPQRRKSPSNLATRLLAGLALCGKPGCRAPMRSSATRSGKRYLPIYRCSSTDGTKGHASRSIEPLEDYVEVMILEYLAKPEIRQVLAKPTMGVDMGALNLEAETLRHRKAVAESMFARGKIDGAALESITAIVDEELAAVTARMASGRRATMLDDLRTAESPPALWKSWPLERRRRALPEFVTIVVLPGGSGGHGFRPDLVVPEWVDQAT